MGWMVALCILWWITFFGFGVGAVRFFPARVENVRGERRWCV